MTLRWTDPDRVRFEGIDPDAPTDDAAGRPIAIHERLPSFTVVGQLRPTTTRDDRPDASGAMRRADYVLLVRKRDWTSADPRSEPFPREGDHVTGYKKARSLTGTSYTALDVYVDSVRETASGGGRFNAYEIRLVDRAPR